MALNYMVYQYDGSRTAVVMTDMDGWEIVIDCDRAEAQVVFDEPEDAGILARLARKEPASYNSNFHLSSWLVFMKERLHMAKRLLKVGGTIWISISEDGMHYLKVLADDIFGAEHFVGTIPRRTRSGKSDVPFNFSQDFDWILVYTNVSDEEKVLGRKVERSMTQM